jgi:hypothetical protein
MATNQPAAPYGWELATDANGNQRLVPAKAPPTSGPSAYDDVTGLAKETLMPRWSDFSNATQNAWNAGTGMASQGYNELNAASSPEGHWGSTGKMIAGAGQAALSPFAGAYNALIGAPAGRIGPGFEHAADVASLISPADFAALAKARAATALPAGMAEHAGAAGVPANFQLSGSDVPRPANMNPSQAPLASTEISGQAPGVSQVGTAELPRAANANVEGATGPDNTNISSAASQAKVDQVAREAVADESATRDATSGTNYQTPLAINGQSVTATPVDRALTVAGQASPVDRALTVAGQASPQFSQIPGGPLAMFAQPHSGAQYQPMSASSRSWTDPHMPQPSNPMPWGDSAPAGHLDTTPTGSIPTAPARATAPSAAAPTAPAQSSPGFFSGLFKDPYAGMSPKQMNEAAQRMQGAGDEYGANLLTQRADNAITSSDGSFAQGGSVDENHPVVQRAMHLVRGFLLNG